MERDNIYKLTNGKKIGGWQLPLSEIQIEKFEEGVSVGLRGVTFMPGSNSYFTEDLTGTLKPISIWFEDGIHIVPKKDKVQNALLQAHPYFKNGTYILYDKDAEATKRLEELRVKDDVRLLISSSDPNKIQAVAIAVFGEHAVTWSEATCELELREFADKNPLKLKNELNSKTYESKLIGALAFGKGIVKTNLGKSAVIWNDTTEGVILPLARGERGITKLSEFLAHRTDESELVLQTISKKVKEIEVNVPKEEKSKDALILELQEKIKQLDKEKASNLVELRNKYKEKFNKDVPARFKNDPNWLESKLNA